MLCATVLAACGGDSGDSDDDARDANDAPAATATSEKDAFSAAGDKLCRQLAERFPRARADRPQSPAAGLKAATGYRDFSRELSRGLAGLSSNGDAEAEQIVSLAGRLAKQAQAQADLQKRVVAAKDAGNVEDAFREALVSVKAQQRMMLDVASPLDKRMRARGLEFCGRPQNFGARKSASARG